MKSPVYRSLLPSGAHGSDHSTQGDLVERTFGGERQCHLPSLTGGKLSQPQPPGSVQTNTEINIVRLKGDTCKCSFHPIFGYRTIHCTGIVFVRSSCWRFLPDQPHKQQGWCWMTLCQRQHQETLPVHWVAQLTFCIWILHVACLGMGQNLHNGCFNMHKMSKLMGASGTPTT